MSGSVEKWLAQMREQPLGGLVTRVIAMRDRRSGDALFEVTDETDLGILAARIDAIYLNAGVTKYELWALDDQDRILSSLRIDRTEPVHTPLAPRVAKDRVRLQRLLETGEPIKLLKAVFESDERLLGQLEAANRRR